MPKNSSKSWVANVAVFFGDTAAIASYYGVVNHNTANRSGNYTFVHVVGRANSPPSQTGTVNNRFVDDNTIAIKTMRNAGRGCLDAWGGAAIVWRRNSTLNCLVPSHGVLHSGGPHKMELYDNTLRVYAGAVGQGVADGYRLFHHHGSGESIAFGNRFTAYSGKTDSALEMTHYRSATPAAAGYEASLGRCDGTRAIDGNRAPTGTYFGYPCWRQPGRDFAGKLKPMYVLDNQWSDTGAKIEMTVSKLWGATAPSVEDHVKAERDYYNAISAAPQSSPASRFNGATGMGFVTLANHPATCTMNATESGSGYWATDTQTLYRCSAANTWVAHYRPYTYPHPLTQ